MFAGIRAFAGVLTVAAFVGGAAHAGPQDYRFEAIQQQVKSGKNAVIDVRLVHVPTGKPVADAVIFRTRLDMAPMGMADMTAKATAMKTDQPGVYRFQADLGMAGGWALTLQAKVPGEAETVQGTVKVDAAK